MGNVCVLLILIINTVFCYHFYNPATHQLLELPSLNNVPRGYKLIPPPRSHPRRRSRLIRGGTNGYCGDGGFTCNTPYDKSQTFQFECTNDEHCPRDYKCCPQKCFVHKICINAINPSTQSKIIEKNNCNRPGQCDKWPYNCKVPYHYSTTYQFKCNQDTQCPKNFKCCQQSCFVHKICSKIVTTVKKMPKKIVPTQVIETISAEVTETAPVEIAETTPTEVTQTIPSEVTQTIPSEVTQTIPSEVTETDPTTELTKEEELIEPRYQLITTAMEEDEHTREIITEHLSEIFTTKNFEEMESTTVNNKEEATVVKIDTTPKRTTLDSNAINPNYAEYYYHYDNPTNAQNEDYEDDYNYDEETSNTRGTNGYCGDGGFSCSTPYDKSQTFQFECSTDEHCPRDYKCCPQRCFLHKICIKAISYSTPSKIIKINKCDRPGQCDKWPYNCRVPYHYSSTYQFKCNQDTQCPKNFKCCQQSCFVHKICSRIVTSKKKSRKLTPATVTKTIPTEVTETIPTTVTETTPAEVTEADPTTTEFTTEVTGTDLIEPRYQLKTTVKEEAEETTYSTNAESTTVADEISTTESFDGTETTTVNYEEETTTVEVDTTVEEKAENSAAVFKTTIVEIAAPKRTAAPEQTTIDPNAINGDYGQFYYDYNTKTTTQEDDYEDEEDYNYEEENADTR